MRWLRGLQRSRGDGVVWFYDRLEGKGWNLQWVNCEAWPIELKITVSGVSEKKTPWMIELDRFLLIWLN
jgi:hypothetical protein